MNVILARALVCTPERCQVQPLDGGESLDAPLAPRMIELGTRIRSEMIVALDRDTVPPTIRYRFETRPIEALAGDRLTILGRDHPFLDQRPMADRALPLGVGEMISFRFVGDGKAVVIHDTIPDGRPRHPELLEAQFPAIVAHYEHQSAP
jgi:hypothetical protein